MSHKILKRGIRVNYQFKYQEISKALYEALKDDPFYIALEKSILDREHAEHKMLMYFDYSIYESQRYGEVFIPEGNVFGASLWSKPLADNVETEKLAEKKAFLLHALGENSLDTYDKIVDFMSNKAEVLIGSNAWYLSIVGVLPRYQGKGYGLKLVNPMLSRTDQLNTPTYLETFSPRTKKFYRQLGYIEVGVIFEPTTQAEYSIMKRGIDNK